MNFILLAIIGCGLLGATICAVSLVRENQRHTAINDFVEPISPREDKRADR